MYEVAGRETRWTDWRNEAGDGWVRMKEIGEERWKEGIQGGGQEG